MRLSLALGLIGLAACGCSKQLQVTFLPNLPPEVLLTGAPVSATDASFYSYRMQWSSFDPDGKVVYYLFATLNPDSVDIEIRRVQQDDPTKPRGPWRRTTRHEEIITFPATQPDTVNTGRSTEYNSFAVLAVDDRGALSKPVWTSLTAYTEAPGTMIEIPRPGGPPAIVAPSVRIRWDGRDPDGQTHRRPIYYRYRLFRQHDPGFPGVDDAVRHILNDTRILRWMYAPTFAATDSCPTCAWDSISGDHPEAQYHDLIPQQEYLFAVTGFDEAGAYDPVFSIASNLLKFRVDFAVNLGPRICMSSESFDYCYSAGGYSTHPFRIVNIEVPAGRLVRFNWLANSPYGSDIRSYRWVMDLEDLSDSLPRLDEQRDWTHWSTRSLQTTRATIGPFPGVSGEEHTFYIEAEDSNGIRSLGIIRFAVVRGTFERDLLFVNDTRLVPDWFDHRGNLDYPRGSWPTTSELDTFFFARGGNPWKGYPGYGTPSYTPSPRGVFDGFTFDTLSTRGFGAPAPLLSRLSRYKVVVWYVDAGAATLTSLTHHTYMISTLRRMTTPGNFSTLVSYLEQGGRMWLLGGGAGLATLAPFNRPPLQEFTPANGELIPGRVMYDVAHWRSALSTYGSGQYVLLNIPEFAPPWANAAPGRGWTGHGTRRDLAMPDYRKLADFTSGAAFLLPRNPDTDPPSPMRDRGSIAYPPSTLVEYLGTLTALPPNFIREDFDPDTSVRLESTLDTLYFVLGAATGGAPIMTYYHGAESTELVFSGFPLWFFSRPQVHALADFVLRDIFKLERSAAPPAASLAAASARRGPAPPTTGDGRSRRAAGDARPR